MISLASASSMTSAIKVISSSGDNATHNVSHRRIPPSRNRCAPRAFSKRSVELGDCCFKSGGSDRFRCSRSSSICNNKRRTSGRVVKCKASLALTDVLFTTGTVMVMPFYALMISKPNSRVTRNLMESKLLWLILGVLYIVAAYLSLNSEDVVRAILNAFTQQQGGNTAVSAAAAAGASAEPFISRCLTLFSNFMSTPETACASWLHLISLDVFLARGVFLDAMEWGTPCRHSVLLCCMFGPLGVLAHAFTRYAHRTIDSMFA